MPSRGDGSPAEARKRDSEIKAKETQLLLRVCQRLKSPKTPRAASGDADWRVKSATQMLQKELPCFHSINPYIYSITWRRLIQHQLLIIIDLTHFSRSLEQQVRELILSKQIKCEEDQRRIEIRHNPTSEQNWHKEREEGSCVKCWTSLQPKVDSLDFEKVAANSLRSSPVYTAWHYV
jgi:hypothetical protein